MLKRIVSGETERLTRKKRRYHCVVKAKTPIVILVNKSTASSAEILAAALKENGRAVIVGETTFGKGIGQTTHKMPNNTELDLTSFRIYTPKGDWVGDARSNRVGIKPDIEVKGKGRVYRSSLKRDKQLYTAWKQLTGVQE